MAKFIDVKDVSGEDNVVNVDHIFYLHREVSRVTGEDTYCVEVPGRCIWITEITFYRLRKILIEL